MHVNFRFTERLAGFDFVVMKPSYDDVQVTAGQINEDIACNLAGSA